MLLIPTLVFFLLCIDFLFSRVPSRCTDIFLHCTKPTSHLIYSYLRYCSETFLSYRQAAYKQCITTYYIQHTSSCHNYSLRIMEWIQTLRYY
ncbi:hypothetical protein FA15DRAFT_212250 [Coprinopsis marcescibilis]|uniref:Secreted protein n=1 Tax=Coprinopsis marcescibilis TaxID=230819 RepID=A0A5C3L3W9_COPMA|nr:hypothetical protein FA15DRAFT_212250 [Coprinopsis marcescibilis]